MVLTALRQRIAAQPRGRLALISVLFIALAVTLSRPLPRSAQTTSPGFAGDYTYSADQHVLAQAQERPKRVAIVGAGASGAAAAWFLRRAGRVVEQRLGMEEGTVLGDIVVFEREGYVGGRAYMLFRSRSDVC
jgi:prenylcysteine oxidase/farnesylcysteine lyase